MIRDVVQQFPAAEKFRLGDKIIRSTRFVTANIAVGHGRHTYMVQHHFCIQARGSHCESLNHLQDALDEGLVDQAISDTLLRQCKKVEALLNGYISYLRKHIT
jgi:four helix bundle protein